MFDHLFNILRERERQKEQEEEEISYHWKREENLVCECRVRKGGDQGLPHYMFFVIPILLALTDLSIILFL